jgi:iron complex transport system permease protein
MAAEKQNNLPEYKNRRNISIAIIILATILFLAFLFSLCVGRYAISLAQLFDIILGKNSIVGTTMETVIFQVRIPRILAGIMVGAALAVSGAAYQGMFKNPMVSPDILGASAGAGFGAAIAILLSLGASGIEVFSFLFALVAVAITYVAASVIGRRNNPILVLVLTGMVVAAMFSSFTSITKYVADTDNKLPAITFWLMGGLSSTSMADIKTMTIPFILGMIPIFLLRWKLNILSFGEEEAKAMGVDTQKMRLVIIVCSTLLTAAAVSIGGMVGWIGLIIPHVARILVGPNYKALIPASLLAGSIFLLLIDDVARSAFPVEIPLGILTSLIGAPLFLYLLFKGKKSWI